jgi:hypothetical protein
VNTVDTTNTCDDAAPCTTNDKCSASGICAGTPKTCNDGNASTDDSCAAATGVCVNTVDTTNTCSDSLKCTTGDACNAAGDCKGTAVVCNDSQPCTDDACNSATGACVFTPDNTNTCSDGNDCTVDSCVSGVCNTPPMNCNDGDPCTADSCFKGVCQYEPLIGDKCDDKNACTSTDVCQANGLCAGQPMFCEPDGKVCTADVCLDGMCEYIGNMSAWSLPIQPGGWPGGPAGCGTVDNFPHDLMDFQMGYTIEFWIELDVAGTGTPNNILDFLDPEKRFGFAILFDDKFSELIWHEADKMTPVALAETGIPTHLVFERFGPQLAVWVNGKFVKMYDLQPVAPAPMGEPLFIGCDMLGPPGRFFIDGLHITMGPRYPPGFDFVPGVDVPTGSTLAFFEFEEGAGDTFGDSGPMGLKGKLDPFAEKFGPPMPDVCQ